jgi:antitoxin MazE
MGGQERKNNPLQSHHTGENIMTGTACGYTSCIRDGINTMTQIAKWGNSLGVRIPQNVAEQVGWSEGTQVVLEVSQGQLIIKAKRKKYSLSQLLEQITPENLHPETDTGESVGNEIY